MEGRAGDFQNGITLDFFQMPHKTPFTNRQLSRIVMLWGQPQSLMKARRESFRRIQSHQVSSLCSYSLSAFRRTITRFIETASAKPSVGKESEKSLGTLQSILWAKDVIEADKTLSVRARSLQLDINSLLSGRSWERISRCFPIKPKPVLPIHKLDRIEFSR